ncbi:MAG: histidine--tRNA ligase [Deltaproteobacteria bacterium]|nr:histidine--tRNA ligase [Deltaproteobacteria bacterium]
MIQLIRGFKDILPGEVELWQHIEKTAVTLFQDFGYKEIRIPIMERTELFARSIGEDTDIVEKEMYTFPDRKGDLITLRPEATASICRSYIQHKLHASDPVRKFYTIGPMFRRERPQKGRYRQFYQINLEVFGIESPLVDVELIFLLTTLLTRLSISDVQAHINSLGCPECRPRFKSALADFINSTGDRLCSDCIRRKDKNPLRVLDCKVPGCKEAMTGAPSIIDHLCPECRDHFEAVKSGLNSLQVPFAVDPLLVRGLDYYTRTTFEIHTGALGAQSAVAGGGRYDGLIKALGGPQMPATGFAIGFDRLAEIAAMNNDNFEKKPAIFIAALGEKSSALAFEWSCALGLAGVVCDMYLTGKSLKSQMKRADRLGAKYVLILGDREIEENAAILRNMLTKEQTPIGLDNIVDRILTKLGLEAK